MVAPADARGDGGASARAPESAGGCVVVAGEMGDAGAVDAASLVDVVSDAPLGDATAAADGSDGAAVGWLRPRVYVYGNSLVWGSELPAATVAVDRLPAQLAARLGARWESDRWIGRSGWSTSMLITAAPHDLAAEVAEQGRARKVLVFWEGVNELGNPWACEAYEIMTRRRVAEGWTVVLVTATPTPLTAEHGPDGGAAPSAYWRDLRRAFNACVSANAATWGAAAVVDIDALPELGDPWDTAYYLDGTHLTRAGYAVVADAVAPVVDALYVAPLP